MTTKKQATKKAAVKRARKAGDVLESMARKGIQMKVDPSIQTSRRAMVVYTSFPIASAEDGGVASAKRLVAMVRDHGGIPLNPLDVKPWEHPGTECPASYVTSNGHSAACYLRADISEMLECDVILFAQGCWNSVGCRAEMHVAEVCGIPFFFETAEGYIVDQQGKTWGQDPDSLLFEWGS